ncbi:MULTISPECIES: DUF350 domain-containing protein [Paenibacillus]|uniref:UPF0719 transmembrane protein YshE n=1 Tax=Paenibacillus albilobatus TaxID=2716884 RepID=A0A919XII5_9BACL|nr:MULTISPECIES: DUF350 domain-containing protein [Paenibacillus]GIO31515.1 UPF0719 transmembrane protein YshE [Paenibacillus albilobatus]
MKNGVDQMLSHPLGILIGYFSVAILGLIVFLYLFELVARYNCWKEISRGNVAASLATGGKIFAIANVLRYSIEAKTTIYDTMKWAVFGYILLFVAYLLFEFLTPVFSVDEEIRKDNRAVGIISLLISVSLSYVIGACIY